MSLNKTILRHKAFESAWCTGLSHYQVSGRYCLAYLLCSHHCISPYVYGSPQLSRILPFGAVPGDNQLSFS